MTTINLFPWRQLKREKNRKQLIACILVAMILNVTLLVSLNHYWGRKIAQQTVRNQQLNLEIKGCKQHIEKINALKKLRRNLLNKLMRSYQLNLTRTLLVRLFDELIKVIPDDAYVSRMERVDNKITLLGYANSYRGISTLMRNIEQNKWLHHPVLIGVKYGNGNKDKAWSQFTITFMLAFDKGAGNEH